MLHDRARVTAVTVRVVALALLSTLLLAPARPAQATILREMSLAELTASADRIVVARVVGQESRWEGTRIVTDVELQVRDVAKGNVTAGEHLSVTVLGGSVDGIGMKVIGEARFVLGEQALVFIAGTTRDAQVVGMTLGRMPVTLNPATRTEVVRADYAGASLLVPDAHGRLRVSRVPRARLGARPLADVLAEIRLLARP